MTVASFTNALQIAQNGKGIPYGGTGEIRADGDANYGFKNLKGKPERLAEVPELADDEPLADLVASLNETRSAFATVGCVSAPVDEEQGHRVSGYIEFAFDSAEKVADATSYFPVFFHFDRALHRMKFDDQVHFHWELMGASFRRTGTEGFTMTVTVNTGWYPSADEARIAWANGLDFLGGFLQQVPHEGDTPIFIDD